jgi:hypothetical protein
VTVVKDETSDDFLSPKETAQRRDEALRRALNTPPQPKHGKVRESTLPKDHAPGAKPRKRGRSA